MNDDEIIAAVLAGDTAVYAKLVDKYKSMVFTLAFRFMKSREDAEEIAQDTFVKAYLNLRQFRNESKFSTWLYRIVFNLCMTVARKVKREVVSFDDAEAPEPEEQNILGAMALMERKDNARMIRQALDKLPGEEAAMVTMAYYENYSMEEISKITGLTVSNVKVKLFRARKKLYSILEKEFILETPINKLKIA